MTVSKTIFAAILLAGLAGGVSSAAEAGEWRLNPRLCPDLREDMRDRRHTYGLRDLREDIRDSRTVNCPASAWVWVSDRGRVVQTRQRRPDAVVIHFDPDRRAYYRRGRTDVNIVFHFD